MTKAENAVALIAERTLQLLNALNSERLLGPTQPHEYREPDIQIEVPRAVMVELYEAVASHRFSPHTVRIATGRRDEHHVNLAFHDGRVRVYCVTTQPSFRWDR